MVDTGWTFALRGQSQPCAAGPFPGGLASRIVGAWFFDQGSHGTVSDVSLTHSGRRQQGPDDLPRGEAVGEVVLVHVFGEWAFERCGVTFAGGHGVALMCDGDARVSCDASVVGGLDVVDAVNAEIDAAAAAVGGDEGPWEEVKASAGGMGGRDGREGGLGWEEGVEEKEEVARRRRARAERDADKDVLLAAVVEGQVYCCCCCCCCCFSLLLVFVLFL